MVYVRAVGAMTPLGQDWPTTWRRLCRGDCAIAPVEGFDTTGYPSRVAAQIKDPVEAHDDRRLALARHAVAEVLAATLVDAAPDRIGVFVGAESGRASLATILALARAAGGGDTFDHTLFGTRAVALAERIDASVVSPAAVASALAGLLGATGPAQTVSLACASGAIAISEAVRAIRLGVVDVALCGGVGADVDPLMLAGFGKLGALSERGVSCPFDVRRDGFVVGEGAAFLLLSRERGDADVAITGIGRSLDAHHLTAPHPDGAGAKLAMRAALSDAGLSDAGLSNGGGAKVAYVQAHGTSTPLNDAVEAAALREVLGDAPLVSSVKGALGHWIAGAGAIGLLAAIEATRTGVVPPTANLHQPDADCALDHVLDIAIQVDVPVAMVDSFAFGGANACLVVERLGS